MNSLTTIKERPILFSGAMVRGLLDGTKTQTRRSIKPQPEEDEALGYLIPKPKRLIQGKDDTGVCFTRHPESSRLLLEQCSYGQPGDRLWVRETAAFLDESVTYSAGRWVYRADASADNAFAVKFSGGWKPSIFMPRVASRILLEIVSVRVERLQDISETDAVAEGVNMRQPAYYEIGCLTMIHDHNRDVLAFADVTLGRAQYAWLWNEINGHRAWEANPWVWVMEFKVIDGKEAVSC